MRNSSCDHHSRLDEFGLAAIEGLGGSDASNDGSLLSALVSNSESNQYLQNFAQGQPAGWVATQPSLDSGLELEVCQQLHQQEVCQELQQAAAALQRREAELLRTTQAQAQAIEAYQNSLKLVRGSLSAAPTPARHSKLNSRCTLMNSLPGQSLPPLNSVVNFSVNEMHSKPPPSHTYQESTDLYDQVIQDALEYSNSSRIDFPTVSIMIRLHDLDRVRGTAQELPTKSYLFGSFVVGKAFYAFSHFFRGFIRESKT